MAQESTTSPTVLRIGPFYRPQVKPANAVRVLTSRHIVQPLKELPDPQLNQVNRALGNLFLGFFGISFGTVSGVLELPILAGFKEGHDVSFGKFFERFFPCQT